MTDNSIKFIVDVGVGKSIENYLRDKGYDTKAVREIDPAMSDDNIIRLAATEKRMVVTMDKYFRPVRTRCPLDRTILEMHRLRQF